MSGLTCFLFEGSMETHCDDATWSVSAEVSMSGTQEKERKGERDLEERHSNTPTVLYCFKKRMSIFTNIDYFVLERHHAVLLAHATLSKTLTFALN